MIVKLDNKTADGKQIYRFDCIVDSRRRVTPAQQATVVADNTKSTEKVEVENEADLPVVSGHVRDSWRLISAVEAWPSSGFHLPQLIDYSHNNGSAIRSAVDIINNNKPDLTWNHSVDSKDVAGWVENAFWEESTDIPHGINAELVVDPTYDSKAARGLENKVLRNGSIGFSMDVVPSHPDMPFEKFVEAQGTVVGNEKVRWLPVSVHSVLHMALVPAGTGADQYAGRREFGNQSTIQSVNNTQEITNMLDESIKFLANVCQKLGIDVALIADESANIPEGLEDRVIKLIGSYVNAAEKFNNQSKKVEQFIEMAKSNGLNAENLDDLLKEMPAVFVWAKEGERLLNAKQTEAVEWFDKAKFSPDVEMSEHSKRMRDRIANSRDFEYLNDMIAEYRDIAEAKYGNSQRSSVAEELPVENKKEKEIPADILDSVNKYFK